MNVNTWKWWNNWSWQDIMVLIHGKVEWVLTHGTISHSKTLWCCLLLVDDLTWLLLLLTLPSNLLHLTFFLGLILHFSFFSKMLHMCGSPSWVAFISKITGSPNSCFFSSVDRNLVSYKIGKNSPRYRTIADIWRSANLSNATKIPKYFQMISSPFYSLSSLFKGIVLYISS